MIDPNLILDETVTILLGIKDKTITSIDIPDSVIEIRDFAFCDCTSLQAINVAEDNEHFSSSDGILFNKNKSVLLQFPAGKIIDFYSIPKSVTIILAYAFSGCTSLQSIDIPRSVTKIGDGTFKGCTSLKSLDIPDSVKEIGGIAFEGCTSLQDIDIPNSVTKIGGGAFEGCTSLQAIDIPNSVTEIGWYAFKGCKSLQSIDIPNSVKEIGIGAFSDCSTLQTINVAEDNEHYSSLDGILFNKELSALLQFPAGKIIESYSIPDSVTDIGEETFYGCTSLQTIDIPASVKEIGDWAFCGCTSLQTIDIPNSVSEIGKSAFKGCTSLQSVDIPNSVTYIGMFAFMDCTSLKTIYCQSKSLNNVYIEEGIFDSSHYDSATLFVPPGTRWEYRHHPVFGKFKNIEIATRRN